MPKTCGKSLLLTVLLLLAACSDRGQLQLEHAWMGIAQKGAETAGFLEVSNPGPEPVEILAADSEAFGAVHFYLRRDGRLESVKTLTVPPRGRLQLDGDNGRLGFTAPRRAIHDGDHLPLTLAVRLANGQLVTLQGELHVHGDHADAEHEDH